MLPQFGQNDRSGLTFRPHALHTISRYSKRPIHVKGRLTTFAQATVGKKPDTEARLKA
jgi:hypothetical protein